MPASSSNTRAQTLPEWEEKNFISSADRSGWTSFAMEQRMSAILLPVRYLVMPNLFTNTAMGSEFDWPSHLIGKDLMCSSDGANVDMIIIRYQSDGLAILPVLLDSEGDFKFSWESLRLAMVDDRTFAIMKFPVTWDECFDDTLPGWVFVFIKG